MCIVYMKKELEFQEELNYIRKRGKNFNGVTCCMTGGDSMTTTEYYIGRQYLCGECSSVPERSVEFKRVSSIIVNCNCFLLP
jgi:hypothetical protein